MRCSECLADWKSRNEKLVNRLLLAVEGLDEETLNRSSVSGVWSPAQVVEHMVLAHPPYLKTITDALPRAIADRGDSPVSHSFFGRLILKGVGPGGKAPVPKALRARETRVPLSIVDEWRAQHSQLLGLIEQAAGKDLAHTPVRNPFFGFIRMNLADCFEILTSHTEGHIAQIEERRYSPKDVRQ